MNWDPFVDHAIATGFENTKAFKAGRIKYHFDFWKSITSDKHILDLVLGCQIDLEQEPYQEVAPEPYYLLRKGVIERAPIKQGQFVSNIFTKEKPDGSLRIILDLSEFNELVTYRQFKMDNLQTALNLITPNCYMASIDWKDAYYSVPIVKEHRKFLCFQWQGKLYRYTCLPNGLSEVLRKFPNLF